jgi:hypothetical protein
VLAVVAAGTVAFWLVRRRRRAAAGAMWTEATCPVCIGASLLAERVPALAGLTESGLDDAQTHDDAEPAANPPPPADAPSAPKSVTG